MALSLALFSFMPLAAAQTPTQFQQQRGAGPAAGSGFAQFQHQVPDLAQYQFASPQAFHRISSGHCSDVGLEVVSTPSECAEAAVALGLIWGGDHGPDRSLTPRPEGCGVGLRGHRTFFYDNPANIGFGAGTHHEDRDQVCKGVLQGEGVAADEYTLGSQAGLPQYQIPAQYQQPLVAGLAAGLPQFQYQMPDVAQYQQPSPELWSQQIPAQYQQPLVAGFAAAAQTPTQFQQQRGAGPAAGSGFAQFQHQVQPPNFAVPAAPAAKVQPPNFAVPAAPAAKAAPWKTLSAAAAAGAVPLVYAFASEA